MSVLIRARELRGRPVVTLDTAEAVAEVRDVVFSHASATVVGFTLNRRGPLGSPLKDLLPMSRVAALGRDAIMVSDVARLGEADTAMTEAAESGGRDVLGDTVVTDAGTALGTVLDVILRLDRAARVVGFEVRPADAEGRDPTSNFIPVDDTMAVSGEALVVPDTARELARDDLEAFGVAVGGLREREGSDSDATE